MSAAKLSVPTDVYAERLARASEQCAATGFDALVVAPGPDLAYLTGSTASTFERLMALVIVPNGQATLVLPRIELAVLADSAVPDLPIDVSAWVDADNPYELVARACQSPSTIAVSDALPALHLIPLTETLGVPAQLATPVMAQLRMRKDPAEIDALRRAGAAIDAVHALVPTFLRAGRTEREVAADIEAAIIENGHTAAEFIIVGSGPNGADPHHDVGDRVLEHGDVVVVDIGGPVPPGYFSDCTRTYCLGQPSDDIAAKYAVLEQAQQAAVDAVRPGVTAGSIDQAARSVLTDAGLGEFFVHRTGHGIGVSVHEEPYIVGGNDQTIEAGMAFSVEPGIYFPGNWGARIEDIVIVTDDGVESVNRQPHGLTVID